MKRIALASLAVLLLSSCYNPNRVVPLFKETCSKMGGIFTSSESGSIGFVRNAMTCNFAHVVHDKLSGDERLCIVKGGYMNYSLVVSHFHYDLLSSCVMGK